MVHTHTHHTHTHTHTHTTFNSLFSGTTRVSRYQKSKTNLDFTEARDNERQWHQLGHMQVCTSLQTDNHASTLPLKFFTGQMPFLRPNQQRQSTEGKIQWYYQTNHRQWISWSRFNGTLNTVSTLSCFWDYNFSHKLTFFNKEYITVWQAE